MAKTFGRAAFEKVPMEPGEFDDLCKDEAIQLALNNLIAVINMKETRKKQDFYGFYSVISMMEVYCKFLKEVPQNEILDTIFIFYKKMCWDLVEKDRLK